MPPRIVLTLFCLEFFYNPTIMSADAVPMADLIVAPGVRKPQALREAPAPVNLPAPDGEPLNLSPDEQGALRGLGVAHHFIDYLCTDIPGAGGAKKWENLAIHHRTGMAQSVREKTYCHGIGSDGPFNAAWDAEFECILGPQKPKACITFLLSTAIIHKQLRVHTTGGKTYLIVHIPTDIFTIRKAARAGCEYCLRICIRRVSASTFVLEAYGNKPLAYRANGGAADAPWRLLDSTEIALPTPGKHAAPFDDARLDFCNPWAFIKNINTHIKETFRAGRMTQVPDILTQKNLERIKALCAKNPELILHNWGIRKNHTIFDQFLAPVYKTHLKGFKGTAEAFYAFGEDLAAAGAELEFGGPAVGDERLVRTCLGPNELLPFLLSTPLAGRKHYRALMEHGWFPNPIP